MTMEGKDLIYCRGCDHLSGKKGTHTCDFLLNVGHSRGCPPGVGCPMHTRRAKKETAASTGGAAVNRSASPTAPAARGRKKPDTAPFDELRAMQLYEEGLDDVAMADALGITEKRVQNWRLRMHLKRPNAGQKRKKEKESSMSQANENARCENEAKEREAAAIPQREEAGASYRQVSELPETQEVSAEAAGAQAPEASKNEREEREPVTAEVLLGLCERIVGAGLGKLPLRIDGRDVRDFSAIALIKTPDGAIIEMTS